ncbi:MAG: ASCH domain-containing protein [Clostridia bacterium]|nr:ASCH domain-containing protein [Clostridia bacterium]
MTAEELWRRSGLSGEYEAWAFGEAPDELAGLVVQGTKTATCSAYEQYLIDKGPLPQSGDYSVILNSNEDAVCIVKTLKVYVTEFIRVSEEHAFKGGEGDRSLDYWRRVHERFLTDELASVNKSFDENTKVVCEEFEVIYK